MTPDGGPLIGPTRLANLYLNTGHGTPGWTMGPGSGRILADLLSGRTPEIPLARLTIDRFPQGQGICGGEDGSLAHPHLYSCQAADAPTRASSPPSRRTEEGCDGGE